MLLSDHAEPKRIAEALRAGVRAILPVDISADQLVAALGAALAGLIVVHRSKWTPCFRRHSRHPAARDLAEPLTPRESEVLQMLANGLPTKKSRRAWPSPNTPPNSTSRRSSASWARGAAPKRYPSAFAAGWFFYSVV